MAIDPSEAQGLPDQLAAAYSAAELALLAAIAAAIADGIDTDDWYDRQTEQARRLYRVAQVMAAQLQGDMPALLQAAILEAHQLGVQGADTDLDEMPDDQVATPPPEPGDGRPSRRARVAAIEGVQVLAQVTEQLPLQVQSLYRSVVAQVEVRERAKTGTRLDAAQQALDILTKRGITGFRDGAGRNWSLTNYIEMKSRTLVNQQLIDAHTERMVERGQRLIIVSSHRNPAPQCQPYEGQVLSLDGSTGTVVLPSATGGGTVKVRIRATLADARAAGFQHPNAILGDQAATVLGELENAARSWYSGPSVHLTTARGYRLTVSPNHPVLTSRGWLPADAVREGDQVFSRRKVERVHAAPGAVEHLDDVPTTFEQVFDSLGATGYRTSVTPAADHFHGDGRHYQGEVDVVWAEGALLDILEADAIQQGGELALVRSGVQQHPFAGAGALLPGLGAVGGAVGRTLPDGHPVFLQSAAQRRVADAVDPGEVLAGLACGVSADEVIDIEHGTYEGHCYDLQTSSGAYLTADIVVHNCRHAVSAYIPGATRTYRTKPDREGYEATQVQRALERRKRAALQRQAVAVTPQAKREAASRIRELNAQIKAHTEAHDLKRRPRRERIGVAR